MTSFMYSQDIARHIEILYSTGVDLSAETETLIVLVEFYVGVFAEAIELGELSLAAADLGPSIRHMYERQRIVSKRLDELETDIDRCEMAMKAAE
jgi:hypothetical protein